MSGWTRASLFAALNAAATAAVLVLSAGPASADPDPGDPGVVAAPPAPAPPPFQLPPLPGLPPHRVTRRLRRPAIRRPRRRSVPWAPPGVVPAAAGTAEDRTPPRSRARRRSGPRRSYPRPAQRWGRPADHHQLPGPRRRRRSGAGCRACVVHPAGARQVLLDDPTQLRWRPLNFWPANTTVNIDAGGTKSSFRTGDQLIATADDATHQLTVTRNGAVEKTIPMSMGMTAGNHQTPNGTYYVQEKMPSVVMDSSTYGVPVNSTYGYKVTVTDAVRFDNVGDFVHSAPWSVDDQGKRDVSHGCINISPSNARWFFDNFGPGDPIIVKNSSGGSYKKNDGSSDWITN